MKRRNHESYNTPKQIFNKIGMVFIRKSTPAIIMKRPHIPYDEAHRRSVCEGCPFRGKECIEGCSLDLDNKLIIRSL